MKILELTLDDLTQIMTKEYKKGEYHARALYREVFRLGSENPFLAKEFKDSPALTPRVLKRFALHPGRIVKHTKEEQLIKFITQLEDGCQIESVIIPMTNHKTLCVSSQVGCKMGCVFCETGKLGFKRNLSVEEITGQVYNARHILKENIKNVVFMGMGEPFDNFENVVRAIRIMNVQKGFDIAYRHITISTAGITSGIDLLAGLKMKNIRLAVSINAADNKTRSSVMPLNKSIPMQKLKKSLLAYPLPKRGTFLFEYILIKGINDSKQDAKNLARFISPLPVRLNLIGYNPVEGFDYKSPSDEDMHSFADYLTTMGVFVVKRWSKGRSVSAGCGQLGRFTV